MTGATVVVVAAAASVAPSVACRLSPSVSANTSSGATVPAAKASANFADLAWRGGTGASRRDLSVAHTVVALVEAD